MRTGRYFALGLVALALQRPPIHAAQAAHQPRYQQIEVMRFTVAENVAIKPDFVNIMMTDLAEQLRRTKKFSQVFVEGNEPADANVPGLRLAGTIQEFKAGSRTKRYLVGFGAGKTKVVAHITFTDRSTGKVLFEDDVDGKVAMGLLGGDSIGAAKGLAKEVAKVTKRQFF